MEQLGKKKMKGNLHHPPENGREGSYISLLINEIKRKKYSICFIKFIFLLSV